MPTTNNNWPTPVATDLVKDGWEAIKDLGDAIDTTLGVYSPATPMGVLLSSTSFSAVSSQAVTSVFSSTYRNYRILFDITNNTADASIYMKLRSGATDSSVSYYYQGAQFTEASALSYITGSNQTTGFYINEVDSASSVHYQNTSMDIYRPFEAVFTSMNYQGPGQSTGGTFFARMGGGNHLQSVSYDGINIIASAGNITGAIQVYGYNQ
jgi:hypothetical protein